MSKINYKSDFDFTLRIYECTVGPDGQKTRVEMGFPTYDFEIRLYTTNRANAYICSKKGNKLQNCFNDEGKIHVVCDNHHLGKGVLHAELTAFLPNNIYPDGSRKTVEVSHTVIELVDGSGDSPSIDDLKLTPAFVSDQGEALRVEAENKRVEAEAERKVAEATRTDSEAQRVEAEAKRNADEAKRIEAENKRKTTEAQRAESEALRDNTEAQRCEAEAQRVAAENLRKTDEGARKTAETQRVTAENERKAAEAQRAKDFEAIKQEVAVEDRIGIFQFNTIVEAHNAVIDGAPDYATQFPSMADGAYRHIIFDKSRRTFLWEIHAGDYPDCPAGDAYTSWKGSEEYVSEGHPRTDRLYRMGNELYRWDGTTLRSYSAAIAAKQDALTTSDDLVISQDNELSLTDKAKYATFDAQWTAAGGTVITPGKVYECNGTDDLTYDEAIDIYGWHTNAFVADSSYRFVFYPQRALLPVVANNEKFITADRMFYFAKNLKVIKFRNTSGGELPYISLIRPIAAFMRCGALREIITPIRFEASPDSAFSDCAALEEVRIYKLRYNISFVSCPLLSLDSLRYMVANAANTSAITITVHADIYAKLTGDTTNAAAAALTADVLAQWQQVLADAMAKNISFATT